MEKTTNKTRDLTKKHWDSKKNYEVPWVEEEEEEQSVVLQDSQTAHKFFGLIRLKYIEFKDLLVGTMGFPPKLGVSTISLNQLW